MHRVKNFCCEHTVSFVVKRNTESFLVTLEIPDLTKNKYSMWSDWGPMYKIYMDPKTPIQVNYVDKTQKKTETCQLDIGTCELNSPMLGTEREKSPFVMVVPDPSKLMVFHLFMDQNGHVIQVKTTDLNSDNSECECLLKTS